MKYFELEISIKRLKSNKKNDIVTYRDLKSHINNSTSDFILNQEENDFLSNITYFNKIIFPSDHQINNFFETSNYFILFKQKSRLSSDFYWFAKFDNLRIISIVTISKSQIPLFLSHTTIIYLLHKIVNENKIISPCQILNHLRLEYFKVLNELFGIEKVASFKICTLSLNYELQNAYYEGFRLPLYYFQDDNFFEIKSKGSIVKNNIHDDLIKFSDHEFEIKENTKIYLCTNGFQNQLHESNYEHFTEKRLKELLKNNYKNPFYVQSKALEKVMDEWIGFGGQTSDILVLGFEI
jgi:hypothetical protein